MEYKKMRYDMHEVVIERPRTGGRYRYHNKRPRGTVDFLEMLPSKEGMRRPYGYDCKEFSDLLGPLKGFLISRVGRKWDDVYSEIRQRLNPNSTVQIHILSHVFQFVERYTVLEEDGRIRAIGRFGYYRSHLSSGEMYVHPVTGILCRAPEVCASWRRRKPKTKDTVKVGSREAKLIDGIWYWVKEIKKAVTIPNPDGTVRWVGQTQLDKRQLNHKELNKYIRAVV